MDVLRQRRAAILVVAETAFLILIVGAATMVVERPLAPRFVTPAWFGRAMLFAVLCQAGLFYGNVYTRQMTGGRRDSFVRIVESLGTAGALLALLYLCVPAIALGRGTFALAALFALLFFAVWRAGASWVTRQVGGRTRLLLVGADASAVALAREIHAKRDTAGVEIVGFVDPDPSRVGLSLFNPAIIGTVEDIPSIVRARSIDRVVVSLEDARGKLPMDKLLEMRLAGVQFEHLSSVYEEYTGKIAVGRLRPSSLIFAAGFRSGRLLRALKRAIDVAVAGVALVACAPLLAIAAVALKVTAGGSVLHREPRVGQHGRTFTLYTLRSLRPAAADAEGRVSGLLRRFRVDDLPELWNVLRGDMSLVGPRPKRPISFRGFTERIPFYGERALVKPGLTGWAQVCYTYQTASEDPLEKLQFDLFYIKHLSLALDIFIIVKTVKVLLMEKAA